MYHIYFLSYPLQSSTQLMQCLRFLLLWHTNNIKSELFILWSLPGYGSPKPRKQWLWNQIEVLVMPLVKEHAWRPLNWLKYIQLSHSQSRFLIYSSPRMWSQGYAARSIPQDTLVMVSLAAVGRLGAAARCTSIPSQMQGFIGIDSITQVITVLLATVATRVANWHFHDQIGINLVMKTPSGNGKKSFGIHTPQAQGPLMRRWTPQPHICSQLYLYLLIPLT